jgi:hypothetical protein
MIKNPLNEEEHVVHSSRLLFYDKGRELTKKEKDELAFVDNGDKFEVESLKEVSKEGEEYRMLVEWKGYSMEGLFNGGCILGKCDEFDRRRSNSCEEVRETTSK